MGYPIERREAVLRKMLPPNNKAIPTIAKEEGICEGTLYNWRKSARSKGRLMPDCDRSSQSWSSADKFAAVVESTTLNESANKLKPEERDQILKICNEKSYRSLPPTQIVPSLADKNIYIGSESSFYRILKEANQQHCRGRADSPRKASKPKAYQATGANQV